MNKYRYEVYGLVIDSEIRIPYLDVNNNRGVLIDISIQLGIIPQIKEKPISQNNYSKTYLHEYICRIEDIVNFYVGFGSKIIIDIKKTEKMDVVYLFLLGHILGTLLNQKDIIAMHGSSVIVDNQAIIFCGDSGVGKSTTAALFSKKGYKLLSDDITVLRINEKQAVMTYRGYAQQKLCFDAIERLDLDIDNYEAIKFQKAKYMTNENDQFGRKPVELGVIFQIVPSKIDSLKFCEVLGKEKLKHILQNIYRSTYKYQIGSSSQYINQLIKIAQCSRFIVIQRPFNLFTEEQIVQHVSQYLKQNNNKKERCI